MGRRSTNAQRCQKYKNNLNSEQMKKFRARNAASAKQYRAKNQCTMTLEELAARRAYERQRKQKQRATKGTTLGPVKMDFENAFGNKQSAGKAVKRLKTALPHSPRKRVCAVKKLAMDVGSKVLERDHQSENRGRPQISQDTKETIQAFYVLDTISRVAPGMKDCKKIGGALVQKRHLYANINETYELYKQEFHETHPIGRSKFASLCPDHVMPLGDMPHSVCVCPIHENVLQVVTVLSKCNTGDVTLPVNGRELIDAVICDRGKADCMSSKCALCKPISDLYVPQLVMDRPVTWYQWAYVGSRMEKVKRSGSVCEALNCLSKQWEKFLGHCYVKDRQAAYYEQCKGDVSNTHVVVQVDFSENYQTFYQDEIQSAHFAYNQVTLFTCCIYTSSGVKSVCILSDHLTHDKVSVHSFMNVILKHSRTLCPDVSSVKVFSDGSAAQFKNRFLFSNLHWYQTAYDLDIFEWSCFATSHGKGPVDGLGGSLKRMIRRKVLGGKLVQNAVDFAAECQGSGVAIVVVSKDEIESQKDFLQKRWEGVGTVKGTQQIHCVRSDGTDTILHGHVSSLAMINYVIRKKRAAEVDQPEFKVGDYVKVQLATIRGEDKQYLGTVKAFDGDSDELEVAFLKRVKKGLNGFVINEIDVSWVGRDQVITKLACPSINTKLQYVFEADAICDCE